MNYSIEMIEFDTMMITAFCDNVFVSLENVNNVFEIFTALEEVDRKFGSEIFMAAVKKAIQIKSVFIPA